MTPVVPLLAGAAVAAALAPGALRTFAANGWTRANYRGAALPFPGGAVAVGAAILALGALAALDELAGTSALAVPSPAGGPGWTTYAPVQGGSPADVTELAVAAPVLCLGVAVLGLLDDCLDAPPRGWRGHAAAVLRGRFSTGALKAAGTLALALLALRGFDDYLLSVLVVVLATNLLNLLDLRPGRAGKAFVAVAAGLLIATRDAEPLRHLGAFAGALLVLGGFDLRERTMLGDTGANVLGALAGLWLVAELDATGTVVALGLLAALTSYAEVRSLSRAIDAIAPLRALDRLGRPA